MDEAYLKILEMIQDGIISAEEGEKLLEALDSGSGPGDQPANDIPSEYQATSIRNEAPP